jgi:Family of unknown function (DUF5762)
MFWYSDPSVLFSKDTWYQFVPTPIMSVSDALNAIVRFSIYLSVLLFLTSLNPWYFTIVPLVMFITIFLNEWFPQAKKIAEGFRDGGIPTLYSGPERSKPTPDNPFMNAQLTDILDNPDRRPADDVTKVGVREQVNQAFAQTSNIYMDTSDVYKMVQSQRNFYTVPQDDHGGFLKFLGKNAKSDKLLSEGYVAAKGTVPELPSMPAVSAAPAGTTPAHT